ncbi:MAG: hypothetical protein P8164_05850 [Gammaproteobacteria bacterium]|jgi:hypothetical protein
MSVLSAMQRYIIFGALLLIPVAAATAAYPYDGKKYNLSYLGVAMGLLSAATIGYILYSTGG